MFEFEKENIQLKYELNRYKDTLNKIKNTILRHSPVKMKSKSDLSSEIDMIPIELSRIFQKLAYQSAIDNSRLYNLMKNDIMRLKELGTRTIDKYTLRDKGVCKFNQDFDDIITKFEQHEYYDSDSQRNDYLDSDTTFERYEAQSNLRTTDMDFSLNKDFDLKLTQNTNSKVGKTLDFKERTPLFNSFETNQIYSSQTSPQGETVKANQVPVIQQGLSEEVKDMVLELRTLNEMNLQNMEEFRSISSKVNILDKKNEFKILGNNGPEQDGEIDQIVEGLEDKLKQLESEMDLELAYANQ